MACPGLLLSPDHRVDDRKSLRARTAATQKNAFGKTVWEFGHGVVIS